MSFSTASAVIALISPECQPQAPQSNPVAWGLLTEVEPCPVINTSGANVFFNPIAVKAEVAIFALSSREIKDTSTLRCCLNSFPNQSISGSSTGLDKPKALPINLGKKKIPSGLTKLNEDTGP